MSVGNSVGIYEGLGISSASGNIAGSQVGIVGNGDFTLSGLTFTAKCAGHILRAEFLLDGELLCSYPIIVENASTSEGVTITTPDFTTASGNNAFVNAENSNNYYTSSEQIEGATTYNFKNYNWGTTEGNEIDINNQTVLGNSVFTVLPAENAGTNKIRKNSTNLDDIDLPDGVSASDTHLYINGSFDADTKTDGIMFSAKWQATLYVAAATNNSGKAHYAALVFVRFRRNRAWYIRSCKRGFSNNNSCGRYLLLWFLG